MEEAILRMIRASASASDYFIILIEKFLYIGLYTGEIEV